MREINLTIDRRRWLQGEKTDTYLLRESDDKMCCLGFLALKCGHSKDGIWNISTPADLSTTKGRMKLLVNDEERTDTIICEQLMKVNDFDIDAPKRTLKQRESLLTKLFKKIGVNVKFTGEVAGKAHV